MAMDIYGNGPAGGAGRYFWATEMGWRLLWDYCGHVAPEITGKVQHGYINDGDGLDAEDARALARILREKLQDGSAVEYVHERELFMASLPDEPCDNCNGTGTRTASPGAGAGDTLCCKCGATGSVRPREANYDLSVRGIEKFTGFLEACGGFSIW